MATYTDNYQLTKPTYAEQADIGVINSNMNKIDEVMHSSQISLAPAYDQSQTYAEGDKVMYELLMYKCISPTTGVWDASKWERTTASESGGGGSAELDILGEASGAVASFADGASAELAKCIAEIVPKQDLHGYSKPWAGGAGKNKFDYDQIKNASGWTESNGVYSGTISALYSYASNGFPIQPEWKANTIYTFRFKVVSASGNSRFRITYTDNTISDFVIDASIVGQYVSDKTAEGKTVQKLSFTYNSGGDISVSELQIEEGSIATSFEPYANICPITPRTEVNITVSATQGGAGTDTQIALGRDVYGGTLNVKTGELTIDRVYLKLTSDLFTAFNDTLKAGFTDGDYLGQHIVACNALAPSYSYSTATDTTSVRTQDGRIIVVPSWASECTNLASFKTAYANQTELEVVHTITPQTVQLTPQEVNSLLGQNNISADTGDIDIVYVKASAPIQPNPTGTPTATLSKLGIEGTVFEIPSGGGGSSLPFIFDSTERVVGSWFGKPLYAQTWDFGSNLSVNSNAWVTTTIPNANMEGIVFAVASNDNNGKRSTFPISANCDSGSYVQIMQNRNISINVRYVTLLYTKITD